MALSETTTSSKDSEKPTSRSSDKKEKPCLKVIIRRLPPSITQEDFITQVSPLPDYDYIYTIKGDLALGEHSFSRVYINFVKASDVYLFKEKFDNYVFIDAKGHEYPAVVEYSAFQKIPKKRKQRPDPKIGSIETDPIYLEFLESLKEQPNQDDKEKPEYSYQPSTENKNDVTTPLLDFLKQRKIDRMRVREEKREERRKKEIERKKIRDDDRKKRFSEKFNKTEIKEIEIKKKEEIEERVEVVSPVKKKERKFEEKKYEKYDKFEKKDYAGGGGYYKSGKYDYNKSEVKEVKKVKKYSERREERKLETNQKIKKDENLKEAVVEQETKGDKIEGETKTEQKNEAESTSEVPDKKVASPSKKSPSKYDRGETKFKNKENDPRLQRRIRNKDRPAMVLYKPGMLRKKSVDNDGKEIEIEGKEKSASE